MPQNPGSGCRNSSKTSSCSRRVIQGPSFPSHLAINTVTQPTHAPPSPLMESRCSWVISTGSSIALRALVNLKQIKEIGRVRSFSSVPHAASCLPSHASATGLSRHKLTASHPGFWQLEPVQIRLLSSPGQRKQSQEPIYCFHPIATWTEFQSAKLLLLGTYLPAPGSWSNSFCSSAISRAWDIFSGSSFGGSSDLGCGWGDLVLTPSPVVLPVLMESKKSDEGRAGL